MLSDLKESGSFLRTLTNQATEKTGKTRDLAARFCICKCPLAQYREIYAYKKVREIRGATTHSPACWRTVLAVGLLLTAAPTAISEKDSAIQHEDLSQVRFRDSRLPAVCFQPNHISSVVLDVVCVRWRRKSADREISNDIFRRCIRGDFIRK